MVSRRARRARRGPYNAVPSGIGVRPVDEFVDDGAVFLVDEMPVDEKRSFLRSLKRRWILQQEQRTMALKARALGAKLREGKPISFQKTIGKISL